MTLDKYDYIESIVSFMRGISGTNFQECLGDILSVYYRYKKKTFEMPRPYGGDDKNDGWVVEDALFYQVYAPFDLKKTFKKEIQEKYEEDLTELLNKTSGKTSGKIKWNGKVNEFIFIVNTRDTNLPHDSERFFETLYDKLSKEYSVEFKYRVVNLDYLREILEDVDDIEKLKSISSRLQIKNFIDPNAITEKMMIHLIDEIAGNISYNFIHGTKTCYERVSTPEKISINRLDGALDEIENILGKLDVVERAVNQVNQDILSENKFDRVKNLVIDKYNELKNNHDGVILLNKIYDSVIEFVENKNASIISAKFLVIYIFDKCDIFEKEECI
ncbi:hypothetical protein [Metaclostridioides mangenotii]|uniref:hypothetical protein n=1 Tax=Metaclostridioides mangenotii TaxID=1540 RepID=UPI001F1FA202|nr:hypothetical protein [Clostridioides mangenotii]